MKISIITASFNSGSTIRNTIESVMRQTHQDWELIIKDGGSTGGIKSRVTIMKEHLRGFKKNGIKNNFFRLSSRYFGKIQEYDGPTRFFRGRA